jgi:hypothetical protein
MSGNIVSFEDIELNRKLEQYAAMKQAKAMMDSNSFSDETETDEDIFTINQTTDDDSLIIEEEDD